MLLQNAILPPHIYFLSRGRKQPTSQQPLVAKRNKVVALQLATLPPTTKPLQNPFPLRTSIYQRQRLGFPVTSGRLSCNDIVATEEKEQRLTRCHCTKRAQKEGGVGEELRAFATLSISSPTTFLPCQRAKKKTEKENQPSFPPRGLACPAQGQKRRKKAAPFPFFPPKNHKKKRGCPLFLVLYLENYCSNCNTP